MFGGCEIVAQEEEDPRSRVEGGWGTPGNKGRWGGRRLAVGCQGKKKKK